MHEDGVMDFGTIDPVTAACVTPLRERKRKSNSGRKFPSAEQITNLSQDELKKRYPEHIRKMNERCNGMQIGVCIAIANGKL
jgi:hypothetical protein